MGWLASPALFLCLTCSTNAYIILTEQEKLEFYKSEYHGAPLRESLTFRCTSSLMRFLRTKAMEEGRDYSAVVRRLVISAAEKEGFDRNA